MKVYLVNDSDHTCLAVFSTEAKAREYIGEEPDQPLTVGWWVEEMKLDDPTL